jgi:hypothetical protein
VFLIFVIILKIDIIWYNSRYSVLVTRNIWIGITVGVFIAGFFIGGSIFGIFSSSVVKESPPIETIMPGPQMMNDPQFRQQMMKQITSDPELMKNWMSSPEHIEQMEKIMLQNHDFMMQMSQVIINNQELRLQMMGHMTENPEMMEQLTNMMEHGHVDSRMMSPQSLCEKYGGNWLQEFNECELISAEQCSIMNGTFKECESACRHIPDAEICTKQCVPVCVIP